MDCNHVYRLKKRLAVLLIENERNSYIDMDFEELNNEIAELLSSEEGSNCCHLIITDVLFPCASHPKAFQFALDLMCNFFDLKDIDWSVDFLPERISRFLLKKLEESNDPTFDDQIMKCYKKFSEKLIRDGRFKTGADVVKMYFDYCELLMEISRSTVLNENFASELPEFSEPIMKDLHEILDLNFYEGVDHPPTELLSSDNVNEVAEKYIQWLKYKYELAFTACCIIPSIWNKFLDHYISGCLSIETIFERARKLFELYYWPIVDAGHLENFENPDLDALHDFELLTVFNDVLLSDFMASTKNDFNRDKHLKYPYSLNTNVTTAQLVCFMLETVQKTIIRWFGKSSYSYQEMIEQVVKANEKLEIKKLESTTELGAIFLHDFFNTIWRFLDAEMNLVDCDLHKDIEIGLKQLNSRLSDIIRAHFYLKLENARDFKSEFLYQLVRQFYEQYKKNSNDAKLFTLQKRQKIWNSLSWKQINRCIDENKDNASEVTEEEDEEASKELDGSKVENVVEAAPNKKANKELNEPKVKEVVKAAPISNNPFRVERGSVYKKLFPHLDNKSQ